MKGVLRFLGALFTLICIIWELLEILAIPALLVAIGIGNSFPLEFYFITIGGYFVVAVVIQVVCHCIFKRWDKYYASRLVKLWQKHFGKDTVGDL